ncbi:SCO family protein [Neisseria montereyensis]|uniref:SCO family protein n=1 Tax=Neisseria montereyensis TaxID=2973938 RepID=A0ABT2F946_9NEIS|nr:SCO family protein [Neisseria montereyensis]MCS4532708.1 SCO family protein [Neisseria montereyensis]
MNRKIITLLSAAFALTTLSACQPQEKTESEQPTTSLPATSSAGFHGSDIRHENIGGDFTMTDGNGKPFNIGNLKGKIVLLSFGYTHCPDICPTELLTYNDVITQLGDQAKDVAVVFASVDPDRDTPELVGKYVQQFHPDFIGLTTTGNQDLSVIKKQYRIVANKAQQQSDTVYLIDHTAGAYLLDKNGKVVVFEPYGNTAQQFADDIRLLLKS